MVLYSSNGDVENENLTNRIHEAFDTFDVLVSNQEGIVAMDIVEEEDCVPVNVPGENTEQDISNNGGLIGLIVGVIALSFGVIVSIVCIHRGRRRAKKRLALARQRRIDDEDSLDDSMVGSKKAISTITSLPVSLYSADADTVSSASSPPHSLNDDDEEQVQPDEPMQKISWTSEEALFWLNHPLGPDDEIKYECSAAACRLCEIRRQQGLQANKIITPAAQQPTVARMPTVNYVTRAPVNQTHKSPAYEDSSRFYMFDDTVDL